MKKNIDIALPVNIYKDIDNWSNKLRIPFNRFCYILLSTSCYGVADELIATDNRITKDNYRFLQNTFYIFL